ncbi:MAG: hypothetical protein NTX17_09415 [Candidatus Eisenbacteria bacterium]|nr:hypothetical protein [Candidatus Eisenbacteria bacterium]
MKASILSTALVILLAGVCLCPDRLAGAVITDLFDPTGDDHGPGTYVYPSNSAFTSSSFDVTRFQVSTGASQVYFVVKVAAAVSDPWNSGAGFSLQNIDIYIDKDGIEGSGATWTLAGRNARISPVNAWEVMLWCAPPFDDFRSMIVYPGGGTDTTGVRVAVNQSDGEITLTVPKQTIGTPTSAWRYVVLMLGQNGYETGRVRQVRRTRDEWNFGGGDDGDSDSNIIDVVTVQGLSQEGMLSGYDAATSQVCVLFAEPDSVIPSIVHTPVAEAVANHPVVMEATVIDSVVASVEVRYRRAGETLFNRSELARGGLQYWEGSIPGEAVQEGTVEYYLFASDGLFSSTLPADTLHPFTITVSPDTGTTPPKQVDAIFLFHLNQNLVPYSKVASTACYVGLLETLRAHPTLKFMIHVSGCLLHSLLRLDDRVIDLIKDGVEEGQFEIVGSTYAQNIMYSTRSDSTDFQFNDEQIRTHKRLIEKIFGVSPVSFWNPERTWTQNFVRLLADNGYENVQVEDHILFDSGISGSEYLVRSTSYEGRSVNVFDDDKSFEGTVNYAIDSGNYQAVLDFLHDRYDEDVNDRFAVCYHEDAEATGLWDYENGEDPSVDWANLDALLTALESDAEVKVTTYSEFVSSNGASSSVARIVDGAAEWMGGSAWFAENAGATGNAYRAFFDQIRDTLNVVRQEIASAAPDTASASELLSHAWFDLIAHQYEFLVHGEATHTGYVDWDMARSAYVAARAAREALLNRSEEYVEDLNRDGVDEVVVTSGTQMLVFSRKGGKLLYWFDLAEGVEEIGDENFLYYNEPFVDEAHYVPRLVGGKDVYAWLSGNNIFPEVFDWEFEVRRRAFEDSILVDAAYAGDIRDAEFSASLAEGAVDLGYECSDFSLTKSFSLDDSTLQVAYKIFNKRAYARVFDLHVETAFCPACLEAMDTGVDALKYWTGSDTVSYVDPDVIGVMNTSTDDAMSFEFVSQPESIRGEDCVFGLELTPEFSATIAGQDQAIFSFKVTRSRQNVHVSHESPRVPAGIFLTACVPNPFVASTEVSFLVGPGDDSPDRPPHVSLRVFDVTSRFVATLFEGNLPSGTYGVTWNGTNEKGKEVPSGIYFLRLEGDGETVNAKLVKLD